MTVGLRDFVPEVGRLPLLFRETFRDRDSVETNGATLVGTGTTFSDGLVLNGSGNLLYTVAGQQVLAAASTIRIVFTPGFAVGDGADHYLIELDNGASANRTIVYKNTLNAVSVYGGATTALVSAVPGAAWLAGTKNVLVISIISGSNYVWLNGTLIGSSVTAFAFQIGLTRFSIGSRCGGTSRFVGTIHSVEIYGSTSTSVDEPHLRDGSVVSDIDLDKCLAYLPGETYYRNAGGLFVTDVGGRIGGTALMGPDGTTVAQFPKVARDAGLVRGFSCDGGDQINFGDDDRYSFTDVANDLPFSIACLIRQDDTGVSRSIISKATSATVGEYQLAIIASAGRIAAAFILTDNGAGARIGRYDGGYSSRVGLDYVIVGTYSGNKASSGIRVYMNGARIDTTDYNSGVYTGMQNTATPLRVGFAAFANAWRGNCILPVIDNVEWSPLQVRSLTARMLRLARTS